MASRVNRISRFNVTSLALGLAFLYLPIVILVIYSFNASRLVTVWGGWSLRWYYEFFNDRAMLDAAWMSLRVGAVSATIATVLGMTPPRVETARVLELGCAGGGNLIPMAVALPEAQFVGVDLSNRQVTDGRAIVQHVEPPGVKRGAASVGRLASLGGTVRRPPAPGARSGTRGLRAATHPP